MTNQWGREKSVVSRSSGSSFLLPALLLVLLIAGGAYGWYLREGLKTEIAGLTSEIAGLTQSLEETSTRLEKATSERDSLQKEIAAVRTNSGSWAEDLEKEYTELKLNEVPKLNRLLDKRDADISALESEIASLRQAADAAQEAQSKAIAGWQAKLDAETKRVAALQADVIAQDSAALDLQKQLEAAKAEREALQSRSEAALTQAEEQLAVATTEASELKTRLATLEAAQSGSQKALADAKSQASAATAEAAQLKTRLANTETGELSDLAKRLETATAERAAAVDDFQAALKANADLKAELAAAKAALETAEKASAAAPRGIEPSVTSEPETTVTSPAVAEETPATDSQAVEPPAVIARQPRDRQRVESVLTTAPGLDTLDVAAMKTLGDRLVEGACVTDALDDVFERVPLVALRNLIRDLGSDC